MSDIILKAASGGGSISLKGPSSLGSDRDLVDTSGNINLLDSQKLILGTGNDCKIHFNGTGTVVDQFAGNFEIAVSNASEYAAKFIPDGAVELYHNGTKQCETSANGLAFPSGKGIDFSATSDAAGKSSELLDDYEEGTYTPIIMASGSSSNITVTFSAQYGHYTKIGDVVHYCVELEWTAKSGTDSNNTAYLNVSLPFAVKDSQGIWGSSTLSYNTGLEFDNGGAYCHNNKDGAYIYFWSPLDSGRHDYYVKTSNLHSSGGIRLAGTYKT